MTPGFEGLRVLVLGGSGQLGRRIASQISREGGKVALAGTDRIRLEEAARGMVPVPPVIEFDLRRPEEFDGVIDTAIRILGGIDGVINAAGVVGFGTLAETPDEAIDALVAIDFAGPLKFMKAAAPHLAGGFWVNVSGVVAEQPMAGLVAYSSVKAGLSAATRALSRELRRSGIRVIDVRPPHTETGLANRPIFGSAPPLPAGLDPDVVARRIVAAIESGEIEVPSSEFA